MLNVGDEIRILVDQGGAPAGTVVEISAVDNGEDACWYHWEGEGWWASIDAVDFVETVEVGEDVVNHPSHYNQYPVEVIELTEHMGFLAGNVVKYMTRAPFKGTELQDLEKAEFYLKRLIAHVRAQTDVAS